MNQLAAAVRRPVHFAAASMFVIRHLRPSTRTKARLSATEILHRCTAWCEQNNIPKPCAKELSTALHLHGYESKLLSGRMNYADITWRESADIWAEMLSINHLQRLSNRMPGLPLNEFCRLTGVQRASFYAMKKRGTAPRSYKIGGRVFVATLDAAEWCSAKGRNAALLNVCDWARSALSSTREK